MKLQVIVDQLDPNIKRGDVIGVRGTPFVTQKGEMSVKAEDVVLLAPCLRMLPEYEKLKDVEVRYRKRHLDMITNPDAIKKLKTRAKIIQFLRDYLNARDFL